VKYRRSSNLWESRDTLLQYEAALEWEAQIDEIWGSGSSGIPRSRSRSVASKTPTPGPRFRSERTQSPDKRGINTNQEAESLMEESIDDKPRVRDARAVKIVFEKVLPLWREAVSTGEQNVRTGGLERFHHGEKL
jgi:fanconi-associated nuclease 1